MPLSCKEKGRLFLHNLSELIVPLFGNKRGLLRAGNDTNAADMLGNILIKVNQDLMRMGRNTLGKLWLLGLQFLHHHCHEIG